MKKITILSLFKKTKINFPGSAFSAYSEDRTECVNNGLTQTTKYKWIWNVAYDVNGFKVQGTYEYEHVSFNGVISDTTIVYEEVIVPTLPPRIRDALLPYCFACEGEGVLYQPGTGYTCTQGNCTKRFTSGFSGCSPFIIGNLADWRCCDGIATYTEGADCP